MRSSTMGIALAAALLASQARAAQRGVEYFGNLPLTTQDGKVVHFYDDLLKGKSVVVNLIYTRCTSSCPLETAKLSQVQRILGDRVGKDIFFYSISIDPKHDTPAVLKSYAAKFHARPGWTFLTGKIEDIKTIGGKLGLTSLADAADRDGHQPMMMIGKEPTGQWMRQSAVDNPQFLAAHILHFFDGFRAVKPASYASQGPIHIGKGEYLFKSRCTACHTIGRGDAVGPDLANVTKRRDRGWLSRYVTTPDLVLTEGDPIAKALFRKYKDVRMPNLDLSYEEADLLLGYIDQRSAALAPSNPPLTAKGG